MIYSSSDLVYLIYVEDKVTYCSQGEFSTCKVQSPLPILLIFLSVLIENSHSSGSTSRWNWADVGRRFLFFEHCIYWPQRKGDNTFGTIHLSIWVWVLRKITITQEMQSKICVCLSVIRKHSRSRAACSGQGLLMFFIFKIRILIPNPNRQVIRKNVVQVPYIYWDQCHLFQLSDCISKIHEEQFIDLYDSLTITRWCFLFGQ